MATTKSARVAKTSILSFIESTMVRVVVGEGDNQQTFKVNEDVLCSKSDFFSAELSKKWMDEKKREVKLPEDSPDTFAAWVHWAYTSELAITSRDTKDNKWTAQEIRDEYDSLCTLYLLADKLLDVSATNAIIIAIFEVSRIKDTESGWHVPPLIVVKMVYDGTTAADPLRRLLVDFWSNVGASIFRANKNKFPFDFLIDMVATARNERPKNPGNRAQNLGKQVIFVHCKLTERKVNGEAYSSPVRDTKD